MESIPNAVCEHCDAIADSEQYNHKHAGSDSLQNPNNNTHPIAFPKYDPIPNAFADTVADYVGITDFYTGGHAIPDAIPNCDHLPNSHADGFVLADPHAIANTNDNHEYY